MGLPKKDIVQSIVDIGLEDELRRVPFHRLGHTANRLGSDIPDQGADGHEVRDLVAHHVAEKVGDSGAEVARDGHDIAQTELVHIDGHAALVVRNVHIEDAVIIVHPEHEIARRRRMELEEQFGLGIVFKIILALEIREHIEGITALHYGHIFRYELYRQTVALILDDERLFQVREELSHRRVRFLSSFDVYYGARAAARAPSARSAGIGNDRGSLRRTSERYEDQHETEK